MFGFGKAGSASQDRPSHSRDSRLDSISFRHTVAPSLSLEPAIDGPPSPERIRAYMEQMKRSSVFGNRSRSDTTSSATVSFRPGDANNASGERVLSRKSSIKSNSSGMAPRGERPESMHLFTKSIFSRGRKSSFKSSNNSSSTTLSSLGTGLGGINEATSARERYYGKPKQSRKERDDDPDYQPKASISGPYNFQHVTHTHKERPPNLRRTTGTELDSGFSAIRASQVPTQGELKGIRAEELHFENFSSEALDEFPGSPPLETNEWPRPRTSPNHGRNRKKSSVIELLPLQTLNHSQSHESINRRRRTPPPRPPRSPLSPECPVALPPRVSSRTASRSASQTVSGYFDFAPYEVSQQRPYTAGRPRGSSSAIPPRLLPTWEQAGQFAKKDLPARPLVTPPPEEAWPLTGSNENFGTQVTDLHENAETYAPRRKTSSSRGPEIRWSKSFPDFHPAAPILSPQCEVIDEQPERPRTGGSETLGTSAPTAQGSPSTSPERRFSRVLRVSYDDWEDDIDYCYEHEAEADCHFEWKRCSIEEDRNAENSTSLFTEESTLGHQFFATSPSPRSVPRPFAFEDENVSPRQPDPRYPNGFRPSLLVPSPVDLPELSPMSINSPEPELQTPSNSGHLHPILDHGAHHRSPSFASSFKESQGFTLSPSLLIPNDFASQMEQDQIYEQLHQYDAATLDTHADPFIYNPGGSSGNRESAIMEGSSNRSSYRSSGFSRGSISYRSSNSYKNNSSESIVLLNRNSTASYSGNGHSSVHSAGSLPELVVSSRRQENSNREPSDESGVTAKHASGFDNQDMTGERDRINDLLRERELYMITAPTQTATEEHLNNALSPVAEDMLSPVTESMGNFDLLSPLAESMASYDMLSPVAESLAESQNSMERISSDTENEKLATVLHPAPKIRPTVSTSNLSPGSHGRKASAPSIPMGTLRPGSMGGRQRSASSANLLAQANGGNKGPPRRGSYVLFPTKG